MTSVDQPRSRKSSSTPWGSGFIPVIVTPDPGKDGDHTSFAVDNNSAARRKHPHGAGSFSPDEADSDLRVSWE